jgi:hypothetical protein
MIMEIAAIKKEIPEIAEKSKFEDCPLGKAAAEKTFDKPMSEYDKPFGIFDENAQKESASGLCDSLEKGDAGENTEKLKKEYIDNLKENSEYPETIKDSGDRYEKISAEKVAEKRQEFNEKRPECIKQWEEANGKEWPSYKEDAYSASGKLLRKAGQPYDAHHIHPIALGGKNEASNLTPISVEKHYDKQGVHAPDSPYGRLEKALQGEKKS